MIIYSTADILKKAKQLADLENSDFISYNEELTLLNDAYGKLYQTSIDAGDLLYVKKMCLSQNELENEGELIKSYCLPKDFYQLYSVKVKLLGTVSIPLDRKPKDMPEIARSYEIKNNKILIYGRDISELDIEYFPTPETLFIKNDDINIKGILGKPLALNKSTLITNIDKNINALNVDDEEIFKTWKISENPITIEKTFAGDNGIIVYFTENEVKKILVSDYDEEGSIVENKGQIVTIEDDCIFLEEPFEPNVKSVLYLDEDNDPITITFDEAKEYIDGLELKGTNNKIECYNGGLVLITNDQGMLQIYNIFDNSLETKIDKRSQKVISVGDYNLVNGYGYLVKDAGRGYKIMSAFENTILDYPNNIYFSLLSYMLAMAYKIKQNADISLLSVSYEEALNQYYDMFKRDANASLRINKVI